MVRNTSFFAQVLGALPLVGAGLLTLGSTATAGAQATPRITSQVENSPLVSLPGEVHPWARAQFDRGPAPANLNGRMLLVLKRSAQQEADLQTLLAGQQDPNSPNYHKWITPEEYGKRFGVADADVQTVTGYLSGQGMSVGRIYSNHMAIEVSATPAQIKSTFQTEIHAYSVAGKTFYANNSAPKIPSGLNGVVTGFAAMNNFRAAGGSGAGTQATFDAATHTLQPLYTTGTGNNTTYGVSPADLAVIYDFPSGTPGNGGANVNVGVVGDSDINVSYVNNYRSTFGLVANPPIVVVDGNDPGMNDDAYIAYKQIELIGAVAPNANIYYYTSATTDYDTGLDFALIRAVADNKVQVLVIGYQVCETSLGVGASELVADATEEAEAQGMTIVAAAGNSGAAGCEIPGTAGSATTGYAVNGYASSPYVTAVGGTDFYYGTTKTTTPGNYWSTNSTTTPYLSALQYIPEQVWNDSYAPGGANTNNSNSANGVSVELASGGGFSTVGLDGSAKPEPIPPYQTTYQKNHPTVPKVSTTARIIPDISFFAGSGANNTQGYNNTAYLFCIQPSDCQSTGTVQFTYSGGTEASSAVFAGAVALVVNRLNSGSPYGLGNVNPSLYSLVGSTITSHDITRGSNKLACTPGVPNCANTGVMTGYQAGTGYDAATGLGSLDIGSFVNKYAAIGTTASAITLTITDPATGKAPVCINGGVTTQNCTTHSTYLQYTVTANAASGTGTAPSGDVGIYSSSPLAADTFVDYLTLSGGKANDTRNLLPGGTYNIYAHYGGDSTYLASNIAANPPTLTVQPEACQMVTYGHNVNVGSTTNVPYGTPVSITVEPYSSITTDNVGIPSGSINVIDNGATITTLPINSEGSATFSSNLLAFGAHSIVLQYPGDASFTSCQTGAFLANITKANTTLILNPANANVSSGTIALTAVVQSAMTPNNGIPPSGTITFKNGNTVLATQALTAGFDQNGNAIRTASVTINSNIVPTNGSITVSAAYSGDGNYNPQTTSTTVSNNPGLLNFGNAGSSTTTITSITDTQGISATNPTGPFPTTDSLTLNIQVSTPGNAPNQGCFVICSQPATLSVYANGVLLTNSLAVNANGTESYTVPQLNGYMNVPSGQVVFTVLYSGWSFNFLLDFFQVSASSGISPTLTISDDRTSADFSLQSDVTVNSSSTVVGQQPLVAPVTQAIYNLRFTSLYNFNSAYATTPINLSCKVVSYSLGGVRSAVPPGITCGFGSPSTPTSSVMIGGSGYATSALVVGAANGYQTLNTVPAQPATRWWVAGGGTTLACIFLLGVPARRRKWQSLLGACVLAIVGFGVTGCGVSTTSGQQANQFLNGGSAGSQGTGTVVTPGTYTVLVTATTSTNTVLVHTLPVEVLVGTTN